jgi:hypothetical protein
MEPRNQFRGIDVASHVAWQIGTTNRVIVPASGGKNDDFRPLTHTLGGGGHGVQGGGGAVPLSGVHGCSGCCPLRGASLPPPAVVLCGLCVFLLWGDLLCIDTRVWNILRHNDGTVGTFSTWHST